MLKQILLISSLVISTFTFAIESKTTTEPFTNEQLSNIKYIAKLSYIPKNNDPVHGFVKGVPVKILEQEFLINFTSNPQKVTKIIKIGKTNDLGSTEINKETSSVSPFNVVSIFMKDNKNMIIDNLSNFELNVRLHIIKGRIFNVYDYNVIKKYDTLMRPECSPKVQPNIQFCDPYSIPYGFQQRVTLGLDRPTFITPEDSRDKGIIVEFKAVPAGK